MNARALRGTMPIEPETTVDELNAGGLAAAFSRGRMLIIGASLLGGAAALTYAMVVPPRYQAQSEVLVENQESYYTSAAPEGGRPEGAESFDAEAINSQIQVLTSRDLAQQAIDQLKLTENPEFNRESGVLNALSHPLRALGLLPADKNSAQNLALANFADRLTVMSPTKSRVLQIDFLSQDPELAARVANLVAELYIDVKSRAKRDDAGAAAGALKPLISELETHVADADAKVEAFRATSGLYESAENVTAPTLQYGEIARKLADARAEQSAASARADTLRRLLGENRLADATDIANNEFVRQIASQRVALRAKTAAQSKIYLSAHPIMRALQAQNDEIDIQLRAALEQTARGLDNEAKTAATEVGNLTALLESQKNAVGAAAADAARLRELQRDAKVLRDQLTSLSAKYQAALARQGVAAAPADARIISRALAPSQPVFPKKLALTLFGALAGLFFSAFLVAARALSGAPAQPAARPRRDAEMSAAEFSAPPDVVTAGGPVFFEPPPETTTEPPAAAATTPDSDDQTVAAAETAPDAPIELPRLSSQQLSERDDIAARKAARMAKLTAAPSLFPDAPPPVATGADEKPLAAQAPAATDLAPPPPPPAAPPQNATSLAQPASAKTTPARPAPKDMRLHDVYEPVQIMEEPPRHTETEQPPSPRAPMPARETAAQNFEAERSAVELPTVELSPLEPAALVEEPPEATTISAGMAARIATAGAASEIRHGAKILVASAPEAMMARASLTLARALSNDGRAILVQLDPSDPALSAALRRPTRGPGLAQLLSGDASFGDIIHRDGASRLHLIRAGGPVADSAGDLDLVLDALRATYDYVILASGPSDEALRLAPEADLTMVFAEDDASRARLAEDFAAARLLMRVSRDAFGELIEAA